MALAGSLSPPPWCWSTLTLTLTLTRATGAPRTLSAELGTSPPILLSPFPHLSSTSPDPLDSPEDTLIRLRTARGSLRAGAGAGTGIGPRPTSTLAGSPLEPWATLSRPGLPLGPPKSLSFSPWTLATQSPADLPPVPSSRHIPGLPTLLPKFPRSYFHTRKGRLLFETPRARTHRRVTSLPKKPHLHTCLVPYMGSSDLPSRILTFKVKPPHVLTRATVTLPCTQHPTSISRDLTSHPTTRTGHTSTPRTLPRLLLLNPQWDPTTKSPLLKHLGLPLYSSVEPCPHLTPTPLPLYKHLQNPFLGHQKPHRTLSLQLTFSDSSTRSQTLEHLAVQVTVTDLLVPLQA